MVMVVVATSADVDEDDAITNTKIDGNAAHIHTYIFTFQIVHT